jgi:hypothetical protein
MSVNVSDLSTVHQRDSQNYNVMYTVILYHLFHSYLGTRSGSGVYEFISRDSGQGEVIRAVNGCKPWTAEIGPETMDLGPCPWT